MAKLPGQRTLVLVSPGFLSMAQQALSWESEIMDLAAQSGVTINALDAPWAVRGGNRYRGTRKRPNHRSHPLRLDDACRQRDVRTSRTEPAALSFTTAMTLRPDSKA